MRLLLDTHIALWAVTGDETLGPDALRRIEDADCYISVAALWEIAIKNSVSARSGEAMPFSVADAMTEFRAAGFELLQIETSHIAMVESLPDHHRDPFDRLMIAQALSERLLLATRDQRLPAYGDAVVTL